MAINYIEMRLEDCMDAIIDYRGKTPKKVDNGIPLITAKIIKNGRIQEVSEFIAIDDYDNWMVRGLPLEGDVVLTTEAPLGEVAQLDARKVALAQRVITLRGKKGTLENDYLLYLLQSSFVQNQLDGRASGSTVTGIKQSELREIILRLPPTALQKSISHQLKCLDKKIDLNNKINQTLEQMSQTLFKSWFVDFDPVIDNTLDAGNPIPEALQSRAELRQKVRNSADFKPLPADIRAMFPSEFEEMELGLIPKGWKFSNVDSLLKNTIGGDWGSDSEDEKHTAQAMIVRGTDIPELISGKLSSAPYRWVEPKKLEKRRINVGDIIIEVSGGSPTQSTGRSIFMTEQIIDRLGGVVEPASFCRKFEPLSVELGLIISLHLSKIYNDGKMWEYQNQSTGIANFQTKYFLEAEQIVIPSAQVINAFYRIVMPWIDKSHNNEQIILGNLRDTLLPKLISGELSLEDLPNLANQTEPA
ncbi:restriction endonuclease subunit S [Salmonella enterica subsp. enterica serovar Elokate]|nr:restriction endonuclease subunit S [Salmonella enterica subsp. enterica serovar Elokate]